MMFTNYKWCIVRVVHDQELKPYVVSQGSFPYTKPYLSSPQNNTIVKSIT
jgi:hypothetical protein